MTERDFLKAVIDFWKILFSALLAVMFAIVAYNVQKKGSIVVEASLATAILAIPIIVVFILFISDLDKLRKQPPQLLNVKLIDVNLNDDIILKKDEKFKITFEKDDKGNLIIKKG